MRRAFGEIVVSLHVAAMRELAHTLQGMGLIFAFSSKTALSKYEGRFPPEDIHVAIFIGKDEKVLDQRTIVQEIAEAAQDRRAIVNLNSQLWYTADANPIFHGKNKNARHFTISITQWELQPCDIRYLDFLPYVSPMFLLLSMLESLHSFTAPRTRSKVSKLLGLVQSWHISKGETIDSAAFSRFPRSLGNAKELCKQFSSLRDSFLPMGVNGPTINVETQGMEEMQLEIVLQAATSAVTILQNLGIHCALFGGMACYLYGNTRIPNDIDILALPQSSGASERGNNNITAEEIKQYIAQLDPTHFFLREPRNRTLPYKVLWYRRPSGLYSYSSADECKIDIVLPGVLQLPNIRLQQLRVDEQYHLPVIPFSLLLLHKLKAWDDRVNAQELYKRARQGIDSSDVHFLLSLPPLISLKFSQPWDDEVLFSKEFQAKTKERVRKFCLAFPWVSKTWRELGFDTEQSGSH